MTHAPNTLGESPASPTLLMVAGELSGDMHGAALIKTLQSKRPDLRVFGIGGPAMREAGMETLYDVSDMAAMGFVEVLRRYGFFRRVFFELLAAARDRQPDGVILIDYPGFNLRFARRTHALGIKTIYYICPQVWAWHRARIPRMAASLDQLIAIFPFEAHHFEGTGLKVDYVGHPLVDEMREFSATPQTEIPWQGSPRIALLPGSRRAEIDCILPDIWKAAGLLQQARPDASFIVAAPDPKIEALIRARIATLKPAPARWSIVTGQTREVLRQATAAMAASGTVTLEGALLECPMLLVYKMAAITHFLAKRIVKTDHIGLASIVLGKKVCPEFIQDAATPSALAEGLIPLLTDTPPRARMIADYRNVKTALGQGGAAQRAANLTLESIGLDLAAPKAPNTE